MIAGVGIDSWKLPVFEKGLTDAGYKFENKGEFRRNVLILHVEYVDERDKKALQVVIQKCNDKCRILKHG